MSPQRYVLCHRAYANSHMSPSDEGAWVTYDSYLQLQETLASREEVILACKERILQLEQLNAGLRYRCQVAEDKAIDFDADTEEIE